MATNVINASPIISADAVEAVLLGFRIAFSRASVPAVPPIRAPGQPSTAASGRTARFAFIETPTKRISVPKPSASSRVAVVQAAAEDPVDEQQDPERQGHERDDGPEARESSSRQVAPSRTAAIGGTRVALIAGPEAREQRHDDADDEADDDRARSEDRAALREVDADRDEQRVQALRDPEPEEEAEHRSERARPRAPRA